MQLICLAKSGNYEGIPINQANAPVSPGRHLFLVACCISVVALLLGHTVSQAATSAWASSNLSRQHIAYRHPSGIIPTLKPAAVLRNERARMDLRTSTVDVVDNPRKYGLGLLLDEGTRKSHSVAENTAFMTGFFKGIGDRKTFAQLTASLYFVYEAMEQALDATEDEAVKAIDFPELRRTRSLAQDMEFFNGPQWRQTIKPSPAAQKYVEHIRQVAATQPRLLIAHQYTRYLGDLFGGQMMGGMAAKNLNLLDGQGLNFYQFTDIDNPKTFITKWYSTLNAQPISDEEQEAIVEEANVVFLLNIGILEELGGNAFSSMLRLLWSGLKERLSF